MQNPERIEAEIREWIASGMSGGDPDELKIVRDRVAFVVGSDWSSRVWACIETVPGGFEAQPFWFALSDDKPLPMNRHNWLHLERCRNLQECFEELFAAVQVWTRQGLTATVQRSRFLPEIAAWTVESGGVVLGGDRRFRESFWREPVRVLPVFEPAAMA